MPPHTDQEPDQTDTIAKDLLRQERADRAQRFNSALGQLLSTFRVELVPEITVTGDRITSTIRVRVLD